MQLLCNRSEALKGVWPLCKTWINVQYIHMLKTDSLEMSWNTWREKIQIIKAVAQHRIRTLKSHWSQWHFSMQHSNQKHFSCLGVIRVSATIGWDTLELQKTALIYTSPRQCDFYPFSFQKAEIFCWQVVLGYSLFPQTLCWQRQRILFLFSEFPFSLPQRLPDMKVKEVCDIRFCDLESSAQQDWAYHWMTEATALPTISRPQEKWKTSTNCFCKFIAQ